MSALSDAGRIGVWGASGSGKSSYVKKLVKKRPRLIVFDPQDEYGPLCKVSTSSFDEVRAAIIANYSGFRIAFKPPSGKEAAALNRLSKLVKLAQQPFKEGKQKAQLTLVVEEMNLSFPVHGGDSKSPAFAELCSRGRHYGINLIGVSQGLSEVSTRFRRNTTETVILRQKGKADTQAAIDATGATKADVMSLKNLEFLHERNGAISKGKITF